MKYSLGISNFLEEISSLSHSIVFLYFFVFAPNPAADHCWPMPLLETPGHSQASLGQSLVGSLLLSPGSWCTQGSLCALQESVSQSCVSSGGSMVGLMVTSSNRAYAKPRSTAPKAPAPTAVLCWPIPPQKTPKVLSQSLWGNLYAGQEAIVRTGHGTTD